MYTSFRVLRSYIVTYLSNGFFLSANDAAHIVSEAIVANVLALQEILCHNLVNFFFCVACEAIPLDIELNDAFVSYKTAFKCRRVALIDLVT